MTQSDYEKALLVAASWRLAKNNDVNEILAIACVIRNWVVPRFQARVFPMNGQAYFKSYSEAVDNFFSLYPLRAFPTINEAALIDPDEGILVKVDSVYDCTMVDMTSSRANPFGARYFGRANNPSAWFRSEVLERQDIHPLIGQFGSQAFHA